MNYQQTLKALYHRNEFNIKLGLENIRRLLQLLGNPHDRFPAIHIAGTNGKGSVANYLASILKAAGYRTGLYTSPHLVDFRERIQVDGKKLTQSDVIEGLKKIEALIKKEKRRNASFSPTYFEIVTALALDHFSQKKVEVAILETGLGGRWDATNTCRTMLSIITEISYDHQQYLGSDLPSITLEKTGIIKRNIPVVSSKQNKISMALLKKEARQMKSPLFLAAKASQTNGNTSLDYESFHFKGEEWRFLDLKIKNLGKHQIQNASTALTALEILKNKGYSISEEAVRLGLWEGHWPGRFQVWQKKPLLILDGGHNVAGLKKLTATLDEKNCRNPIFVFGLMQDKEVSSMVKHVSRKSDTFFLVQAAQSKALNVDKLSEFFASLKKQIHKAKRISIALPQALKQAKKEKRAVCVCGSLYLVGETLSFLKQHEK